MGIIGVTNLKEIERWEGYFHLKCICNFKEEKCEEHWQFSETNISRNAEVISFNFDMQSSIYVRQKTDQFGRNQLSSFGDTEGWIWHLYDK